MSTKSTRVAAMEAIQEAARVDDKIVIVSPDAVAAARATAFKEEFPDRVIEVGIAEQDAVDIAAGHNRYEADSGFLCRFSDDACL